MQERAERIITNVLNIASHESLLCLFSTCPRVQIAAVIVNPRPGEWGERSPNARVLVFGLEPHRRSRVRGHALGDAG